MNDVLSNLPFPKAYLLIGVLAIVVVIVVATSVARCTSDADEQAAQTEAQQQEQQEQQETQASANGIPEDLLWRDTDFAVDPARTSWPTKDNGRKVVYLTIDDGPSSITQQYLDLFDQYGVKATFFVTGQDPDSYNLIFEAYKRGHTIGLHSMTHDYEKIYASEDAYFTDLDEIGKVVKAQIGYVPCFIRFPGGSSNALAEGYSKGLMRKLVAEVQARGYQYYDWNEDTGDGAGLSTDQIVETVKNSDLDTNIVLLCHDAAAKQSTLEALPTIIEYYQNLGYTFEAIDRNTMVPHHALYVSQEDAEKTEDSENPDGESADDEGTAEYDDSDYADGEDGVTDGGTTEYDSGEDGGAEDDSTEGE